MAKLSIGFGVVLILLGIWGFVATGNMYPTALIPTWFGFTLAVSGVLARTADEKLCVRSFIAVRRSRKIAA